MTKTKELTSKDRFKALQLEISIQILTTVIALVSIIVLPNFLSDNIQHEFVLTLLTYLLYTLVILLFFSPLIFATLQKRMFGYAYYSLQIVNTDNSELSSIKWFFRSLVKLFLPLLTFGGVIFLLPAIFYPVILTNGKKSPLDFLFGTKAIAEK